MTRLIFLLFLVLWPWTVKAQWNPDHMAQAIEKTSKTIVRVDSMIAENRRVLDSIRETKVEVFPPEHWADFNRDTTGNYPHSVLIVYGGAEAGGWLGEVCPDSHLVSMGTVRRMIDSALARRNAIDVMGWSGPKKIDTTWVQKDTLQ